jgi:hypothetical protein
MQQESRQKAQYMNDDGLLLWPWALAARTGVL